MYLTNEELQASGSISSQVESPAAFIGTSDVNFFNAQMNPTWQPDRAIGASAPGNLFIVGFPDSAAAAKRIKRGVRDTMLNKQTKEAHALPESLAAANLDVVARVKILGLLVKGVDKIATMG
jgi:hypothetical protein